MEPSCHPSIHPYACTAAPGNADSKWSLLQAKLPFMLWRDSSAQHFNTPDGSFIPPPAPKPIPCKPFKGVVLMPDNTLVPLNNGTLAQQLAQVGFEVY